MPVLHTDTPVTPASVAFSNYVAKFKDPAAIGNGEDSNNFSILRYTYVLLMYAEAARSLFQNSLFTHKFAFLLYKMKSYIEKIVLVLFSFCF